MEIITYVLSGAVEHRDSLGTVARIGAGEVQRMSAGRGLEHSETNPSPNERAHLLQIWIVPSKLGLEPSYEQTTLPPPDPAGELRLIAGGTPQHGALMVHQDVNLYRAIIAPGGELNISLRPGRHAWLQVVAGIVELEAGELRTGDGLGVSEEDELRVQSPRVGAELLVFDLA
jgi:redox-sensitive bicupin YhaK (pirin superfamily)